MEKEHLHGQEEHACGCGGSDGHGHGHEEGGTGKFTLARFAAGAVLLIAGMILQRTLEINPYIFLTVFVPAYLLLGADVVLRALKNIARGKIFDENFLMTVATLGAFAIGEYVEAVAVMLFYQAGEFFQGLAVRRARKSIAKLMDIRPDFANILKDGALIKVKPDTLAAGELFVVKPGEKIPLDGIVQAGESMIDTAALSGESVPRSVGAGNDVLAGSVNLNGLLTVKASKPFAESAVSKILKLAESAAEKKAPTEKFITKFAKAYTPAVVGLAVLIAVLPPLALGGVWMEWIRRALVFLVISCPCALVISIPLGFFGGIGGAAKRGILIKGGNYLEALNQLETIVFDKTGTLTKGVFRVTGAEPAEGFTAEELLELAACAEVFSNHPAARSVLAAYGKEADQTALTDFSETAGKGVSVKLNGKTILAGNQSLLMDAGIAFFDSDSFGTKIYVAYDGVYAGCIVISDEIKPDARAAVDALKARGIRVVMLSGDRPEIVKHVAEELGIGEFYGGLLPHEKAEKVEALNAQKRKSGKLAFVGDGINDAPVLALSDIGAAMGNFGSDAAVEAADIVLMTDEPSKIVEALGVAKRTKQIVWQNILFAFFVKAVFLVLGAFGIASLWEAVFADVGVALIAVLNSLRAMRTKKNP